jgi:hypothetical protein
MQRFSTYTICRHYQEDFWESAPRVVAFYGLTRWYKMMMWNIDDDVTCIPRVVAFYGLTRRYVHALWVINACVCACVCGRCVCVCVYKDACVYSALQSVYLALQSVYSAQQSVYSAQQSVYSALQNVYSALQNVQMQAALQSLQMQEVLYKASKCRRFWYAWARTQKRTEDDTKKDRRWRPAHMQE